MYMMSNGAHTVLYIGVTNNLERRVYEHKQGIVPGFTEKYKCHELLYYEETADVGVAIAWEKQLKKWSRAKKERLIDSLNLKRRDLSTSLEMTETQDLSAPVGMTREGDLSTSLGMTAIQDLPIAVEAAAKGSHPLSFRPQRTFPLLSFRPQRTFPLLSFRPERSGVEKSLP